MRRVFVLRRRFHLDSSTAERKRQRREEKRISGGEKKGGEEEKEKKEKKEKKEFQGRGTRPGSTTVEGNKLRTRRGVCTRYGYDPRSERRGRGRWRHANEKG